MPIEYEKKLMFIHVPKTGGYTLATLLHMGGLNFKKPVSKHRPIVEYKVNYEDYFKFTFVRNPFERMLSRYFHNLQNLKRKKYKNYGSFVNFVKTAKFRVSMSDLLSYKGKLMMDFVGKYENFKEDVDKLCKKLGIENNINKIDKLNKSKHKHYSCYYNDEARAIIAKAFKKDLEVFGYEFETVHTI